MNKYLKEFLHRGAVFGGGGPIIAGIIFAVLDKTVNNFSLDGKEVLVAIASTYLLAFIQAGASVFNQIEEWNVLKSTLCHFSLIYVAYLACYLVNSWIPFRIAVVLIFTLIFLLGYLAVWLTVVISVKAVSKKLNKKIK